MPDIPEPCAGAKAAPGHIEEGIIFDMVVSKNYTIDSIKRINIIVIRQ